MDADQRIALLEDKLDALTMTVGTGEHTQLLLHALTQSTTSNARDVASMQAAVARNYDIKNVDSLYLKYPTKMCLAKFSEHCKALK